MNKLNAEIVKRAGGDVLFSELNSIKDHQTDIEVRLNLHKNRIFRAGDSSIFNKISKDIKDIKDMEGTLVALEALKE